MGEPQRAEEPPVLHADDLRRRFPGPPVVDALRGVDLRVEAGEFVTIQGPSGSGKSTLLQLLGLLDSPSAGSYRLAGREVTSLTERDRSWLRASFIGFVFQAFHLLESRSAEDNVAVGLLYRGASARAVREQARGALSRVGMAERGGQAVHTMSGGERQRVAIARALVGQPRVLLCDEPTGNLDTTNSAAILGLFSQLNAEGSTIVLITHDPDVALLGTQRRRIVDGVFE